MDTLVDATPNFDLHHFQQQHHQHTSVSSMSGMPMYFHWSTDVVVLFEGVSARVPSSVTEPTHKPNSMARQHTWLVYGYGCHPLPSGPFLRVAHHLPSGYALCSLCSLLFPSIPSLKPRVKWSRMEPQPCLASAGYEYKIQSKRFESKPIAADFISKNNRHNLLRHLPEPQYNFFCSASFVFLS